MRWVTAECATADLRFEIRDLKYKEAAMSWILIFSSTLVPILMLGAIILAESLSAKTKPCMVKYR